MRLKRSPHLSALVLLLAVLFFLPSGCDAAEKGSPPAKQGQTLAKAPRPVVEAVEPKALKGGERAELIILSKALATVQRDYYDQTRVKPPKMMAFGLDALQSLLPDVVADFDRPLEDGPEKVNLRVNGKRRAFELAELEDLSDVTLMSADVLDFIVENVREPQKPNELEYALVNGMLDTLDPHSSLLSPEAFEEMQTSHGGFVGLGIVIGIRDDLLTVVSPIEGTPASKAGLKARDQITRIGDESTINMPLHEAVDRMRGEVGTTVTIYVMRKGWSEPRLYTITRAEIEVRSLITQALVKEKVAYVKIKSFERNTGDDVRAKITEMRAEMGGEIKGLILDLRSNPGGLLTQAVKVADTFISKGELVIQEGVGGKDRYVEEAQEEGTEPNYPVIVLVNPGSASASEIVAGALKNHDRALIIGDQTFGKGSVQSLRRNDDGSALKLTISQYLTPGDLSIQGLGIQPDVRLVPVTFMEEEGLVEIDMFVSENIRREGSLDLALQNTKAKATDGPSVTIKYLYDVSEEELNTESFSEDFEISLARDILRSVKDSSRLKMIAQGEKKIAEVAAREMKKIGATLKTHKVSWDESPGVSSQPIEVVFESDAEGVLSPGEEATVTARVTNKGDKPIYRLFGVSESNNIYFDDREFLFGKILPGESRFWSFKNRIPLGVEGRRDVMTLRLSDQNGELELKPTLSLTTKSLAEPHFAYTYQLNEVVGNQDGLLQRGEDVELVVWVKNNGEGDSPEALVQIKNEAGDAVLLSKGRETIGEIPRGEVRKATLRFKVNQAPESVTALSFKLSVYDKNFDPNIYADLSLPLHPETAKNHQKKEGVYAVKEDAVVWGNAELEGAPAIAKVRKGATVKVVAESLTTKRTQITWGEGEDAVNGWVNSVALEGEASEETVAAMLEIMPEETPPFIVFNNAVLEAQTDEYVLKGTIKDNIKVEDYYVYLWHRDGQESHSQKLDYGIIGGEGDDFDLRIPLRKGINRVTLYARDGDGLEGSKSINIHKP